jgi:hypothetical protein
VAGGTPPGLGERWGMPTSKRRIAIVVNPGLEAALERMASASGLPIATIARSFLEEAVPVLNDLSEILESEGRPDIVVRWQGLVKRLQGQVMELPMEPGGGEG